MNHPAQNKTPHPAGLPMPGPEAAASEPRASSDASSLEPLQTSVKNPDCYSPEWWWQPENDPTQSWIHSGWMVNRRRVWSALRNTGQSANRVQRFQECGSDAWVYKSDSADENFKIIANHCGDRFCMVCGGLRSFRVREALRPLCQGIRIRMATLTLLGKGNTLRETLDMIYRYFRALRQTPLWEDCVTGGCAFLEIKWDAKHKRWHTHLHLLLAGKYIEQGFLTQAWKGISGDSFIVDVRDKGTNGAGVEYACKYVTKPLNSSFVHLPERLEEAVMALRGKRLCLCFGSWYGTPLNEVDNEELFDQERAEPTWTSIGSLASIRARAFTGDAEAARILDSLRKFSEDGPLNDSS